MPVRLCVVVSLLSCLCVYFPLSSYLSFSRCRMFTDICRKVQGLQVSFTLLVSDPDDFPPDTVPTEMPSARCASTKRNPRDTTLPHIVTTCYRVRVGLHLNYFFPKKCASKKTFAALHTLCEEISADETYRDFLIFLSY